MKSKIGNFRGLAIEGGGVLGIAYIGALEELLEAGGSLDQFTHFSGTSAGSIMAGLLAIRTELSHMKNILSGLDFNQFLDDDYGIVRDVNRLINNFGWYKGDALASWYRELVNDITGVEDITLSQIYALYGTHVFITKTLVCTPYSKLVIMDFKTHPDKPLYEAVHESSCIPLFFQACVGDDISVDGGVLLNYPIHILYDYLPHNAVLGLYLIGDEELAESRPVENLQEFVLSLVNTLRQKTILAGFEKSDWERTVSINSGTLSATQFNLTKTEKRFLINSGKLAMLEFLTDSL